MTAYTQDNGLDQNGSSGVDKKWPNSGYISKAESVGLAGGWVRAIQDANKPVACTTKIVLALKKGRFGARGAKFGEKDQKLSLKHTKFEISIKHLSRNIE